MIRLIIWVFRVFDAFKLKLNLKSITMYEKNCIIAPSTPSLPRIIYYRIVRIVSYFLIYEFITVLQRFNGQLLYSREVREMDFYFFLWFLWGNFYLVFLAVPIIKLHIHKNTFFSFMVRVLSKEIKRKQNNTN